MKHDAAEVRSLKARQKAPLLTPTDLAPAATKDIAAAMNGLAELCEDNKTLATRLREAHNVCDEHRDVASSSSSSIEVWIDETERRTWFLFEAGRPVDATGH